MNIPTVKIVAPNGECQIINQADFDPSRHELFDEQNAIPGIVEVMQGEPGEGIQMPPPDDSTPLPPIKRKGGWPKGKRRK